MSMIVAGDEHTPVPMKPGCGVNADGGGSRHGRRGGEMMRGRERPHILRLTHSRKNGSTNRHERCHS